MRIFEADPNPVKWIVPPPVVDLYGTGNALAVLTSKLTTLTKAEPLTAPCAAVTRMLFPKELDWKVPAPLTEPPEEVQETEPNGIGSLNWSSPEALNVWLSTRLMVT